MITMEDVHPQAFIGFLFICKGEEPLLCLTISIHYLLTLTFWVVSMNTEIDMHFLAFRNIEMVLVVDIHYWRQISVYSTKHDH